MKLLCGLVALITTWPRCTCYYVDSLHLLLRGLVALVTMWPRCTYYYVASLHLCISIKLLCWARLVMRWSLTGTTGLSSWYVTSHPGQLSFRPSARWEMSTRQSSVIRCDWLVEASIAHCTCGLHARVAGRNVWSLVNAWYTRMPYRSSSSINY